MDPRQGCSALDRLPGEASPQSARIVKLEIVPVVKSLCALCLCGVISCCSVIIFKKSHLIRRQAPLIPDPTGPPGGKPHAGAASD